MLEYSVGTNFNPCSSCASVDSIRQIFSASEYDTSGAPKKESNDPSLASLMIPLLIVRPSTKMRSARSTMNFVG